MPRFAEQVEVAIEALSTNPPQPFEENEFIDASRLVYDGVRDIRKAVLMIRVCTYVAHSTPIIDTLNATERKALFPCVSDVLFSLYAVKLCFLNTNQVSCEKVE